MLLEQILKKSNSSKYCEMVKQQFSFCCNKLSYNPLKLTARKKSRYILFGWIPFDFVLNNNFQQKYEVENNTVTCATLSNRVNLQPLIPHWIGMSWRRKAIEDTKSGYTQRAAFQSSTWKPTKQNHTAEGDQLFAHFHFVTFFSVKSPLRKVNLAKNYLWKWSTFCPFSFCCFF